MDEIKYNRNALANEIERIISSEDESVAAEGHHMRVSMEDLDNSNAPDGAYIPLLARAQSL